MEYDDYQILNDYSQLAKAYYDSMKKRGFVFFRLDDVEEQKLIICQQALNLLEHLLESYKKSLKVARGKEQQTMIKKLCELSQRQIEQLKREFPIKSELIKTNLGNPLSCEAKLIKKLFEIYKLEDNERKNLLVSSMIEDRLETLSGCC